MRQPSGRLNGWCVTWLDFVARVHRFAHGQLYVAASRVGRPAHIRFALDRDATTGTFRTRNVVYREALTP